MDDFRQPADSTPAAHSSKLFWIVLFSGVFLSVVAWRIALHYEQRVAVAMFQVEAKERSLLIRKELETVSSALEDLASMYAVTNLVTGEQFTRFVAPVLARNPALVAMSWNPVIAHEEREAHEAALRQAGLADYRIVQRSPQGEIETAAPRDEYVVVGAIEPLEGNETARGFDVASEETRRSALERARDSASLAIAAPITLVQSRQEYRSALGFLPRYRTGSPFATIAERRANLEGFFVAVVDLPKIIAAALSNLSEPGIELRILATAPGAAPKALFVSNDFRAGDDQAEAAGPGGTNGLHHATSFAWGGQQLGLRFAANNAYRAAGQTWAPWGVLLAVLTVTFLTAAMVFVLRGRAVRIAREVADRTRELRESNRELEEEVSRRKEIEERLEAYQLDLEREVAARTAELNSTTNQLRTILDSEPECVKIVSADGKLEHMNAAGLAMIEAETMDSARGQDVYGLIADEHRDAFIDLNRRVIAGESATLQFRIRGLRGGERWVDTHAVPLIDPDGGPNRHLAITRDITAAKAAEEQQAQLQGQLRHTQKLESIGVLAGGIAHDFNNLLQVIVGNSEIALDDPSLDDNARSAIEAGQSAAIEAAKLCDQMLTYAGRSRPAIQPIRLRELVESIIDLLGVSHSKYAEFELSFDGAQDTVDGDDAQLRQVVMNLVTNASEAIGDRPGRIVVSIRSAEVSADDAADSWLGAAPPPGRYVCLDVADTGSGMDDETQERMFDPFFTTKFAGRGLGLSATLGIVQSHGGFVKVSSEVGRGTRITVLFPVSTSAQRIAPARAERPATFDQTILLVDDEAAVRKTGRAMLEKLGCRVVLAENGEEAVSCFAAHAETIDVVLLDLAMPRMSGNETCAALRRIRPDVPVIFCSGYTPDAVHPDTDAAGFTGFLHKPFRLDALVGALEEAVRSRADSAA